MWTPEDRALVGDFGSGQALSDDQYRLIEPFLPPAKPGGRPRTTDMRRLLDGLACWTVCVPCRAHGMPVAPRAAASGVSAVADDLRLLPGLSESRGLGEHPPPSGHD